MEVGITQGVSMADVPLRSGPGRGVSPPSFRSRQMETALRTPTSACLGLFLWIPQCPDTSGAAKMRHPGPRSAASYSLASGTGGESFWPCQLFYAQHVFLGGRGSLGFLISVLRLIFCGEKWRKTSRHPTHGPLAGLGGPHQDSLPRWCCCPEAGFAWSLRSDGFPAG